MFQCAPVKICIFVIFECSEKVLFCIPQDEDFFQHLEMYMRQEHPPLGGREHLSFRSYYFPVKVSFCALRI